MQLAKSNNVDNLMRTPDPTETYAEDTRNDNIQEQLLLNNNNNFISSPDISVKAPDINTENNRYVGSLEENVPSVLTELIPMQIFNNFENIAVNCGDNLKDNDVVLNSETHFVKIDKSCTIKNSLIQDKENPPSQSYLDFSNYSDLYQEAIEDKLKPRERVIADVDHPDDPDFACDNQSKEGNEMDSGSKLHILHNILFLITDRYYNNTYKVFLIFSSIPPSHVYFLF